MAPPSRVIDVADLDGNDPLLRSDAVSRFVKRHAYATTKARCHNNPILVHPPPWSATSGAPRSLGQAPARRPAELASENGENGSETEESAAAEALHERNAGHVTVLYGQGARSIKKRSLSRQLPACLVPWRPLATTDACPPGLGVPEVDACPICLDALPPQGGTGDGGGGITVVAIRACGHVFCRSCIVRALEHKAACPMCRTPCVF